MYLMVQLGNQIYVLVVLIVYKLKIKLQCDVEFVSTQNKKQNKFSSDQSSCYVTNFILKQNETLTSTNNRN